MKNIFLLLIDIWKNRVLNGCKCCLLIIINLVEIKFAGKEFAITKEYESNLRNKIFAFKEETGTQKAVHLLMLTTFGVKQNKYSEIVQKELKLNDLFR